MREYVIAPNERHAAVMTDLKAVLTKHQTQITGYEMLALASQLVGQILALQDQTARPNEAYLATVEANIMAGNAMAVETFLGGADETKKN